MLAGAEYQYFPGLAFRKKNGKGAVFLNGKSSRRGPQLTTYQPCNQESD